MVIDAQQYDDEEPLHGIPMDEEAFDLLVSVESPYRYELIDGIVYDMTGSSPEHGTIATNLLWSFREQLSKGGPCRVYQGQYVAIPGKPPVAPDVVLTCNIADWSKRYHSMPFRIQSPLVVIEVLSPKTAKYDRTEKFARYKSCPSLEIYMLVHQNKQHVEVYRRATDWAKEVFTEGQTIKLAQLDLEFALEEMYAGVFDDYELPEDEAVTALVNPTQEL